MRFLYHFCFFLLLVTALGCGDDGATTDGGSGTDTGSTDTGSTDTGSTDTGSTDTTGTDTTATDTTGTDTVATDTVGTDTPSDTGAPDAATDVVAGSCGDLGKICGDDAPCVEPGLACTNGVCIRSTGICGGIVGAPCPGSAPICLTYPGASGWPCVTTEDRDCICATPEGARAFGEACLPE